MDLGWGNDFIVVLLVIVITATGLDTIDAVIGILLLKVGLIGQAVQIIEQRGHMNEADATCGTAFLQEHGADRWLVPVGGAGDHKFGQSAAAKSGERITIPGSRVADILRTREQSARMRIFSNGCGDSGRLWQGRVENGGVGNAPVRLTAIWPWSGVSVWRFHKRRPISDSIAPES